MTIWKWSVEARHHIELFEELGALGERVELARVQPGRHQEIARASRRVLDDDGGLELEKSVFVEVAASLLADLVAHTQRLLEGSSAQIEITVQKAFFLARVDLVGDGERRGLALVEDGELDAVNLDGPGPDLRVLVLAAALDDASDANDPLAPQGARQVVGRSR